jgi:hypothetical protein
MKKTILISLAGLALVLAGCTQQTPITNQSIDQPIDDINQNIETPEVDQNQDLNTNQPAQNVNQQQTQKKIQSLTIGVPTKAKDNPYKNVPSSQGNFSVIYQGREIKVEVTELEKVYYDGQCNPSAGISCDDHNWVGFYDIVKARDNDLGGMPLPTTLKGYFIDENIFRVMEISWQIG